MHAGTRSQIDSLISHFHYFTAEFRVQRSALRETLHALRESRKA